MDKPEACPTRGRLPVALVVIAEIAQSIQIVAEHIALAARHVIVAHNSLHGCDYIIHISGIVTAGGVFALQFVQFLFYAHQPELIAAEVRRHFLDVVYIRADPLEQASSPPTFIAALMLVSIIAIPIPIAVAVLRRGRQCEQQQTGTRYAFQKDVFHKLPPRPIRRGKA
jgi:hypothetical protein